MKKLVVLLVLLLTFSCSVDNDSTSNYQEFLPVAYANLPEEFILNEDYEITITYLRPTTCHSFNDVYYLEENNECTIAIVSTVFVENGNCTELNTELETTFNFKATQTGSYIFKFWQGENEEYSIVEVPVVE